MITRIHSVRRQRGVSLVEMMVALVAGMIVVGAILTFTVSSIRANSEYVQSVRLEQELRNSMDYVLGELRRAGYDDRSIRYVANPASPTSPHPRLQIVNNTPAESYATAVVPQPTTVGNCVIYSYDRSGGTAGSLDASAGEIRGVRRVQLSDGRGAIEVAESSGTGMPDCSDPAVDYAAAFPPACNGRWCPLSDPRKLDITHFRLGLFATRVDPSIGAPIRLRDVQVWMQGRLTGQDQATVRALDSWIKVRADCVRSNSQFAQCGQKPGT